MALSFPPRVGDILPQALEGWGLQRGVVELRVRRTWERAVGPEVARRAWPESFRNGRLTVRASDAIWLHHISMMRPKIREVLNRALGEPLITAIFCRLGSPPRVLSRPPRPTAVVLPPSAERAIREILAPVTHHPWAEALRSLLRCHARARGEAWDPF